MNLIRKIGSFCKRGFEACKQNVGQVVAVALGVLGLTQAAHAAYTDPAADINTAVSAAGAGASTAYISTLTVLASVVIIGLVIWGLRKGVRPR